MSLLRYTVSIQFEVDAGDTKTLDKKLDALQMIGDIVQIKAKSAGKRAPDKIGKIEGQNE